MSHRILQINEVIQATLGELFTKYIEFPLGCLVTITGVETTSDMHTTTVWVSVFPTAFQASVMNQLEKSRGYLFSLLKKRVTFDPLPDLQFKLDTTQQRVEGVEKLFDEIEENDNRN